MKNYSADLVERKDHQVFLEQERQAKERLFSKIQGIEQAKMIAESQNMAEQTGVIPGAREAYAERLRRHTSGRGQTANPVMPGDAAVRPLGTIEPSQQGQAVPNMAARQQVVTDRKQSQDDAIAAYRAQQASQQYAGGNVPQLGSQPQQQQQVAPAPTSGAQGEVPSAPQQTAQPNAPKKPAKSSKDTVKDMETERNLTVSNTLLRGNPESVEDAKFLESGSKGTNKTDKDAYKTFDKLVPKLQRDVASGKIDALSAAKEYEKKLKDRPWHQNNRMWGAALGVGLMLIAGADPRIAALTGALAYGNVKTDELAHLEKLRITDAASFEKESERRDKMLAKAQERDWDREDEKADREADAQETAASNEFTAGQNALNRASTERAAATTRAGVLEDKLYKREKENEDLGIAYDNEMETFDKLGRAVSGMEAYSLNDDGFGVLEGSGIGRAIGKFTDPEASSNVEEYERIRGQLAALALSQQAGTKTDFDYRVALAQAPGANASPEERRKWVARIRSEIERSKQKIRETARRKGVTLSGGSSQIPSTAKVTAL